MRESSFLSEIREFFLSDFVVPVGSGTAALLMSLEAINVRGKKVIIPLLTCPNVAIAVVAAGAELVTADVSYQDYCISVESVRTKMDSSVKAIIAVDAFGYPADIAGLRRVTSPYECLIIEDACQAYGGRIDGSPLGARGDIGLVSFGYSKPVALNGGGLVLTRLPELYAKVDYRCRAISSRMWARQRNWVALTLMLRGRYRLLQALDNQFDLLKYGMPSTVMHQLPEAWRHFVLGLTEVRANLRALRETIASAESLESFEYADGDWLPWRYSFKVTKPLLRPRIRQELQLNGIDTSILYNPVTQHFCASGPFTEMPNARRLVDRTVNLNYQTNVSDIDRVVRQLRAVLQSGILHRL